MTEWTIENTILYASIISSLFLIMIYFLFIRRK